ncbi:MAG: PAS domain S-box protein, partial [Chloroflexota bacterium]
MPTKAMLEKENLALKLRVAALEEQLAASTDLILHISDALITINTQNVVTSWNLAAEKLYGWTATEAIGRLLSELIHTEYDEGSRESAVQSVLEHGEWIGEVRQQRKDGTRFPVWSHVAALHGARGALVGYVGVNRDVTDRKRVEDALRESEERFSRAFHGNPAVQLISRVDNGSIVDVNEACCRLVGCDRDELIGRNATELNFWADSAEQQQKIQQTRRSGVQGPFEVNVRHRSGEMHTIIVTSEPVEFKGLNALISTAIDITQHKKSEKALRESEQRFSTIFNYSPIAMVVSRLSDGRMIDANPAMQTLLGYSREEMIGHTAAELQAWDNLQERAALVEQLRSQKRVTNFETVARMKSGARVNVLVSAQVVVIDQEELLLGQIIDITQRKKDEEALRQAHEELELRVQQRTAELTQANVSLQASKATLLGFYDSAPFMMGVAELDGDKTAVVSANRETATFLAMQPIDLPGRTGIELGTPGDLEHLFVENYKRCQREGVPVRFEYNYPHSSGERWLKVSVSFIGIGVTGHPQFSFVVEDITEHKHAEIQKDAALEKLRENEARLRQVLDSTQDAIFAIDLEYRFLVNNRSHQQALIESGGHLFQVGELILSPDYPPEVVSHWRAAYNRALNGDSFKMETNWPDASGQLHYSENNLAPLRDAAGAIMGVLVVVHDITERKRAEEALQQINETLEQRVSERTYELAASEQKFRELADSITDVFYAFDRELRCTYWNKASELISGIPAEQALGRTMLELFPDNPDVPQPMLLYQNVLIMKQTQSMVNEYKIEGASHFYEIHAYPTVTGLSVFVRDATKIYQIQRELEQSYAHMRDLSRQVIEAQENERRAIGRELHDEIGQTLTGLKILVEMVQRQSVETSREKLVQMQDVVGELIDHVNALSLDLRPPMLDDLG